MKYRESTREDRYYKHYPDKADSFWYTLDPKLVAFGDRLPPVISTIYKVIIAIIPPGTNRREPMPIGNNDHVTYLWEDRPDWQRWWLWHFRNIWVDLKRYYLGFGSVVEQDRTEGTERVKLLREDKILRFWKVSFEKFNLYFPYFYYVGKKWDIRLGWKRGGNLGFTVNKD